MTQFLDKRYSKLRTSQQEANGRHPTTKDTLNTGQIPITDRRMSTSIQLREQSHMTVCKEVAQIFMPLGQILTWQAIDQTLRAVTVLFLQRIAVQNRQKQTRSSLVPRKLWTSIGETSLRKTESLTKRIRKQSN